VVKPKPKKKARPVPEEVEEPEVETHAVDEAAEDGDSGILDIDGEEIQIHTQKLLKVSAFEPEHHYWLDTGSPDANAVFGNEEKGIAYGKVMEIAGPEHCGKTLISNILMGLAQKDGAAAGYIDLEESRDGVWSTKLGVRWSAVTKFYPMLVTQKKGPPILLSAEEICEQAESAMHTLSQRADKQFWFLDSIAMMVTRKQYAVGLSDASMNSKLDRAEFLSRLLPRWAGIAANYNATILLSNQLRAKIGGFVMGDPDDTTGGKALKHVCSVRVRGRRMKGGRLKQGKAVVGLAGVLRNIKNKSGDGSVEGCECGFKVLWNRDPARIQFMPKKDLEDEMGEEK